MQPRCSSCVGLLLPGSQSSSDRGTGGGEVPLPPAAWLVLAMCSVGGQAAARPGAAVPKDAFRGTFSCCSKAANTAPSLYPEN